MSTIRSGCGLVAAVVLSVQGCASRDRWIDCESHLEPINTPAPQVREPERGARPARVGSQQRSASDAR